MYVQYKLSMSEALDKQCTFMSETILVKYKILCCWRMGVYQVSGHLWKMQHFAYWVMYMHCYKTLQVDIRNSSHMSSRQKTGAPPIPNS